MLAEGRFIADRYEILAKVGAGGMSDVYKAKDHVLGRFVAIKVLKPEFADDVNFVTKFRSEAQSAAGLEHPNIVNIYDVGSGEGFHYIVMEYVEGITLKTYIEKKKQLSYKEAISIAIQVGRGIEAAHHKNIIHRDIKPQNIMISTEGKVKVTDFGIARAASSNTIHSDVMGSVHYTSPEQARNGFVDGKSDIYSLGIVMYEMVTGKVPFDGDTTVAIAIQHLQEEMESPRKYVPDLPVSLEKIILKCTQKSADRRYLSMEELLEDLRHALVSPDEDFVTMVNPASMQDKTRVISSDEVRQIKEETAGVHLNNAPVQTEPPRDYRRYETEEDEEDESEEGGGFLNPKMEKAMTVMGIVAALIIAGIIIYLVGSLLGIFKFGSSDYDEIEPEFSVSDTERDNSSAADETDGKYVEMIDLRGMELDEAQDALKKIGLSLYSLGREASDDYEEGQIISQDIEKGEKAEKGTTVKVTVSSGPGEFAVPHVVGNTLDAAKGMLEDAQLQANPTYEYSNEPEGKVIGQSPGQGAMVKKGDTVTLIVSQGKEQVQVPDVFNDTEETARQKLTDAKLKVNVTTAYDDNVAEGRVISQSIAGGNTVYIESTVDIVVSLGKEQTQEPEPGQNVSDPGETAQLYQMKGLTINMPDSDNVVFANIELYDADGNLLDSWYNVSISSFPYTISNVRDIQTASGKLVIEWIVEDEEGNQDASTQTKNVAFEKQ